jgi:dienelactone hydrolase
VDPSAFDETEVRVGAAPWELPGTLSMPEGDGPFPAVVLLAGSGPQDRDETIGPNAPLRDLAHGLASAGIAVLRYDKRTLVHGPAMAADPETITVREETVDDAVAAVDRLRATPGIDPDRVFVVGHSLGGFLAPRVAARAGERVAGIGMLAANTRPLEDVILAQYEYLASEEGGADPQAVRALPAIREQVARVKAPQLAPDTPASSLPLGIPPAYWLDLRTYDPAATATGLEIPMLVVQGGRDYQVPASELDGWRAALRGRDDVTIREYPALNHLLMEGTGPSRPAEYARPGHVASELVEDLAAWVRAR